MGAISVCQYSKAYIAGVMLKIQVIACLLPLMWYREYVALIHLDLDLS